MSGITILAGDLPSGSARYVRGYINGAQLESVAIGTEQNLKKVGGTLAGAVAGGLLFGPLGAIGGMIVCGNKKELVFIATFTDQRQVLARTDSSTFTTIQADIFSGPASTPPPADRPLPFFTGLGLLLGFTVGFAAGLVLLKEHMWIFFAAIIALAAGGVLGIVGALVFDGLCRRVEPGDKS